MIFAGKAVMEGDYAIAYVADAKVIHRSEEHTSELQSRI